MERASLESISERDQVVVLRGLSWEDYDRIDQLRGEDVSKPRFAYLDGNLEIMTTGPRHELVKTLLARLLEAYCDEHRIRLNGLGNTTYRDRRKKAGAEPDECYMLGEIKETPDLAIEVVYTSGGVDKLEIYRRLGVREVWFWINDAIEVYRQYGDGYRHAKESIAVRGIDLIAISQIINTTEPDDQAQAVWAYKDAIRGK